MVSPDQEERGDWRVILRFLIFFLFILFIISSSSARVFIYDGNQSGESIQDLVNAAGNGDSIFLKGGEYYENVVLNRSLRIKAWDNRDPPEIVSRGGEAGITVLANGTEIDRIKVSGAASYGLLIQSSNNKVTNMTILGLSKGIGIKSGEWNRITNNVIVNNTIGLELETPSRTNALFLNYFDNEIDISGQTSELSWEPIPVHYIYSGKTFTGPLGNYWVKYRGEDSQGDGIGDMPYILGNSGGVAGYQSTVLLDTAPLIAPPEYYTLQGREQLLPDFFSSGNLFQGDTMQGSGPGELIGAVPGAISGSGPGSMTGPRGPMPLLPDPFLWLIPAIVILSIGAGIIFERSRRAGKMSIKEISPIQQVTGNETIVQRKDPTYQGGNSSQSDAYYSVRLPPPLDQKYPGAEYQGEGGIGRVFKATDSEGSPVAIKIPIRYDEITGTHFTKELHLWQGLHHENIVEIHSANIFPVPYIEIEYVGESLASLSLPLETKRAIDIIIAVAEGLRYAHASGIIHRDIKPENILIAVDGTPKITDWGLGKAITDTKQTGLISFSLDYASPEQLAPNIYGETGPWTDIYQLGVVLYTVLTGHVPFKGEGMGEVTHAILHEEPPLLPPDIPGHDAIEAVIKKCLAKRPQDRYGSVADLIRDLQGIKRYF